VNTRYGGKTDSAKERTGAFCENRGGSAGREILAIEGATFYSSTEETGPQPSLCREKGTIPAIGKKSVLMQLFTFRGEIGIGSHDDSRRILGGEPNIPEITKTTGDRMLDGLLRRGGISSESSAHRNICLEKQKSCVKKGATKRVEKYANSQEGAGRSVSAYAPSGIPKIYVGSMMSYLGGRRKKQLQQNAHLDPGTERLGEHRWG